MDPDAAGYIGEKFNHFLPNALFIQDAIEFFLLSPELLHWKLVIFTLLEAVVGLALMFGLVTRVAGLATVGLALGILLGAGWLGTTCVDEWQIGILGIGSGLAVFFAGGGRYSLDALIHAKTAFRLPSTWQWAIEPGWPERWWTHKLILPSAVLLALLSLMTNQVFHHGVWGPLHNKSVRPLVEITDATLDNNQLTANFYRVEGADVYGSFTIAVRVVNAAGKTMVEWDAEALSQMTPDQFRNRYIAQVKAGKNSMILPLGAKANVSLHSDALRALPTGDYRLELEDISGARWLAPLQVKERP